MRCTERKPGKPGTGSLPNMLEKSSSTMTGKASVKNTAAGSRRNNFARVAQEPSFLRKRALADKLKC
jgi:hypothetical protein